MISLSRQVAILRGCAHGIGQPTVSGWAWVAPGGPPDWADVDAAMRAAVVAATGVGEVSFAAPDDPPHADMMPALRALRWAGALQRAAGLAVFEEGVLFAREPGDGETRLGFAQPWYGHPDTAVASLGWAAQSLHDLLVAQGDEAREAAARKAGEAAQRSVQDLGRFALKDKNTRHFLRAAHDLGIPVVSISNTIKQYGWGSRARWMSSSYTDRTSAVGSQVARDKLVCASVLRMFGLPVTTHVPVGSVEEACRAAGSMGYPVVVKPMDSDGGRGVTPGIMNEGDVRAAYDRALRHARTVLVERHVEGRDYRLTVLHGEVVWTVWRRPAGVTGNGVDSVRRLMETANVDFRKQHQSADTRLPELDAEAMLLLREQGLTPDAVPEIGRFVAVRRAANTGLGGTPIAVNGQVHPDNLELARQASALLGLDLAGVDLLIPDIAVSWRRNGGVICEVNAQPQFGRTSQQHLHGQVLEALVPDRGRIPVVCVYGKGQGRVTAALGQDFLARGLRPAVANSRGAWPDDEQPQGASQGTFASAQALLLNRGVDALIMEIDDQEFLQTGLPVGRVDVLLIAAPLGGDHDDRRMLALCSPHCGRVLAAQECGPLVRHMTSVSVLDVVAGEELGDLSREHALSRAILDALAQSDRAADSHVS